MRYVVPQVVRPIERITGAMSGLASGDTSIEVPGRDRSDEIGRMAEALGVFRDTAIELQKANQREIREGRRRLAVAIESTSEAFSLYDSEDKLVLCNSKYQTLLYPGGGVDISPGMSFETIVRRFAENGYIKEAEGRVEDWIRERIARHRAPTGPHVQHRGEGQWILVSERKTDDGSIVAVYSDITELKQREAQLGEKTRSLEQLSAQLAKYLSPQVYESIFTGKQEVKIASRSEERRVGKECRSRWSPYHEKKKNAREERDQVPEPPERLRRTGGGNRASSWFHRHGLTQFGFFFFQAEDGIRDA